jgi:citrate lyase alpha subunit
LVPIDRYGHSIEEGQVMNGLWIVILSALAILLTDNLYVMCIDRGVIRFDAKRGNTAWQAALHLGLQLAIRPHSAHLLRKKQIPETHRRRCYYGKS